MMSKIKSIIDKLELVPHPFEGGLFRRSYTSPIKISPFEGEEERSIASAIYYLLTDNYMSRPHSLKQDEIWHFYSGDPLEILLIYPNKKSEIVTMGADILLNQIVQLVIPSNTIFCAKICKGGVYSLIGASLSPAFVYGDYQYVSPISMIEEFPQYKDFLQDFLAEDGGNSEIIS